MIVEKAKSLVKGCGKWKSNQSKSSFDKEVYDTCGIEYLCQSCKSKISATLECWKKELEFLNELLNIDISVNFAFIKEEWVIDVRKRITELKEAIKILEGATA